MSRAAKPAVLCVDDEPLLLEGLGHTLRREYVVSATTEPQEALSWLREGRRFTAIIADMRMPVMSGLALLIECRALDPMMSRILLTGQSEPEDLLRTISQADVFRILNKPCPPPMLLRTLKTAVAHHEALWEAAKSEPMSLEDLWAALDNTHPVIHGPGARAQQLVRQALSHTGEPESWVAEVGALLGPLRGLAAAQIEQICADPTVEVEEIPLHLYEILARVPDAAALTGLWAQIQGAEAEGDMASLIRAAVAFAEAEAGGGETDRGDRWSALISEVARSSQA